jgi:hypothetical protein
MIAAIVPRFAANAKILWPIEESSIKDSLNTKLSTNVAGRGNTYNPRRMMGRRGHASWTFMQ